MKLPERDTFFRDRPHYEEQDYAIACKYMQGKRIAVDVGAHVGYWSQRLVQDFEQVIAFEPVAEHRECLLENVQASNFSVAPYALSDTEGSVQFEMSYANSGMCRVADTGVSIPTKTLDSYQLAEVDFVKIDVEGHELKVLMGMSETVRRCNPLIFVEVLPSGPLQAVRELLSSWGYTQVAQVEQNQIWRHKNEQ